MKSPKAPKAPDPDATASAQNAANISTALASNQINMTNQVGPWGATTYNQTGSNQFTDSFGKVHNIPQYTATTTYNPEQQAIFDLNTQAQTNLANLGATQSAKMNEYLDTPFQFDNQAAGDWAYDLGASRILPQQAQQEEALRTRLVNAGIRPGTSAWNNEMTRMDQSNTDQMNQLALAGRGQAFNEAMATRNQPINEISALLSGSQVDNPTTGFTSTPQANLGGVDYSGMVNQNYQASLQNYQAKLQNSGGFMGGLFGLAGTLAGRKW